MDFLKRKIEEKNKLELELLVDANEDKQNAIWFKGIVCKGKYKDIPFKIYAENQEKTIVLNKCLRVKGGSDNYTELINEIQTEKSVLLFPKILKKLELPIEDETYYAITNDLYGIDHVVGLVAPYDNYLIEVNGWHKIIAIDNILDSAFEETIDMIDEYLSGNLEVCVTCNNCDTMLISEDMIQDSLAAGFKDYNMEKLLSSKIACPNCMSEDVELSNNI